MTDGSTGGAGQEDRGDSLNPARILAGWWDAVKVSAFALTSPPLRLAGVDIPPLEQGDLARAARGFPVVGAAAGLLAGLSYAVSTGLGLPALVSAVIALGVLAFLGGASSEGGLSRTAEALTGAGGAEERLARLKAEPLGTYGILVLVIAFAMRAAAVAAVGQHGAGAATSALTAAMAASYGALPLVLYALPSARASGFAHLAGRPRFDQAVLAALLGAAVALLFLGPLLGIVALAVGALGALKICWIAKRMFGGLSGDLLGAAQHGAEIGVLLAVAAMR